MRSDLPLHRPGEEVSIAYLRDGKERQTKAVLVNKNGTTTEVKEQARHSEVLGADFEPISKVEKSRYGVEGGIRVRNIRNGVIKRMGLPEDYIIVSLNNKVYTDAQVLIKDLENAGGRIVVQGINPDGTRGARSFYWY